MTKDEALKLALEALEWNLPVIEDHGVPNQLKMQHKAITSIYEALAQPEQEPVTWKETDEVECPVCNNKGFPWPKCGHITYLERTPPQSEPVIDKSAAVRIATALGWEPKRTWQGLTDEERQHIWRNLENGGGPRDFADAIEAKLRSKNT